jgi:hypothetical protein
LDSADFESQFCALLFQCQTRSFPESRAHLLKSRHLSDILHVLDIPIEPRRISPPMITSIIDMIRANLARSVPLIDPRYIITDDVQPFFDPEWDHLTFVYQILIRFQDLVPRCPQIDLGFMRMIFGQLGTRDEREHTAIVQAVLRYCSQSRARSLSDLCAAVATELSIWEGSPNSMFAIALVLAITTAVVREFPAATKAVQPLAGQCVLLLTDRNFLYFRNNFFNFVSVLIGIDPTFPGKVVTTTVRFWPHRATSKQAVLLKLFSIALPKLPIKQQASLLPKTFAILAESITSPSSRVAEAALGVVTDRLLDGFLLANAALLLPAVRDAVEDAIAGHWSGDVRELAKKAANRLLLLDPRTWHELSHPREALPRPDVSKMQAWVQITDAASRHGHRTSGKVAQVARMFAGGGPRPAVLTDGRVLRRGSTMTQLLLPPLVTVRDSTQNTFMMSNVGK